MSMSTALTFHRSASSLYSQTQKFMEIDDTADTRKMVTQVAVNFVYYFMRLVATSSIVEFFGFLSFTEKMSTGDIFKLTFSTFVGDEIWKLIKANESALTSKDYASTMFSKNDTAAIQNPSTASEDAVLASLISLNGISKQLKNITRQTSANVIGEAQNKLFLASLEGLRGQISSILDIDNPCGQSHIIEAQCAASSTSEEEDEAGVKLKPDI